MSYSSVFLLVSGLFAMIKNGASLKCYDNDSSSCIPIYNDRLLKECLTNKQKDVKAQCPLESTVCLTARLKDDSSGEQFMIKGCSGGKGDCNSVVLAFSEYKTDCDVCESDYCNSDQKGPNSDQNGPNSDQKVPNSDQKGPNSDQKETNSDQKETNSDQKETNSDQKGPSPEVKQNKTSSRSSSSCIHLSVFALFFILGAFFI